MADPIAVIEAPEQEQEQNLPLVTNPRVDDTPLPGSPLKTRSIDKEFPFSTEDIDTLFKNNPVESESQPLPIVNEANVPFSDRDVDSLLQANPVQSDITSFEAGREKEILSLMDKHNWTREEAQATLFFGTEQPTMLESFTSGFKGLPQQLGNYDAMLLPWAQGQALGSAFAMVSGAWNGVTGFVRGASRTAGEYAKLAVQAKEDVSSIFKNRIGYDPVFNLYELEVAGKKITMGNPLLPAALSLPEPVAQSAPEISDFLKTLEISGDLKPLAERPYTTAIGSGIGSLGAQIGLYSLGGPITAFAGTWASETGLMYEELQGGTDGERLVAASIGGAAASGLEMIPLSKFMKIFKNASGVRKSATAILGTSVQEAGTEFLTAYAQAGVTGAYNRYTGKETDLLTSLAEEILSPETFMEAKLSAVAGLFAGGVVGTVGTHVARADANVSEDEAVRSQITEGLMVLTDAIKNMQASETVKAQFVEDVNSQELLKTDAPDAELSVSFDNWRGLFQSPKEAIEMAEALGVGEEVISDSAETGVPMRIRFADAVKNLTPEMLADLVNVTDLSSVAPDVKNSLVRAVAVKTISEHFRPGENDPVLGPLFVEESYQRIDGFADKALAAWQAHKKPGLAERTLTKKRNEFRDTGLLLENRAAMLEEVFGTPRQATWDRWNIEFVSSPEQAEVLLQTGKGHPRAGFFQADKKTIIGLFKNNDRSSLVHELGHLFLRDMQYVSSLPATERSAFIDQDWEALQVWLGMAPGQQDMTTAQEEKFAKTWEAYFFEGVAPAAPGTALYRAFQKFSGWMKTVYTTVKQLGGKVDPKIAQIFDRMIATEGQIQSKVNNLSYNDEIGLLYELQKQGALTVQDLNLVGGLKADVIAQAEDSVNVIKMKNHRRVMADARRWANKEYSEDPNIKMIQYFTSATEEGTGLNYEYVLQAYGEDGVNKIRAARGTRFLSTKGKIPDTFFGDSAFNPDDFFTILTQTPKKDSWIIQKTAEYIQIEDSKIDTRGTYNHYGEVLDSEISRLFSKAINNMFGTSLNPKPLADIQREAKRYRGDSTPEQIKSRQQRLTAASIRASHEIKNLLDIAKSYTYANNIDASTPVGKSLQEKLRGDLDRNLKTTAARLQIKASDVSFVRKLTDLFNQREQLRAQRTFMREAAMQRKFLDQSEKFLTLTAKRAEKGTYFSPEYSKLLDSISRIVDKRRTKASIESYKKVVRDFVAREEEFAANGLDIPLPLSQEVLQLLDTGADFRKMTFKQREMLDRDIRSIAKIGRTQFIDIRDGKTVELKQAVDEVVSEIMNPGLFKSGEQYIDPATGMFVAPHERQGKKGFLNKLLMSRYVNTMARQEFVFDWIAGTQGDVSKIQESAMYRYGFDAANKANDAKIVLIEKVLGAYDAAMAQYTTKAGRAHYYELITLSNGMTFSRQQLFAMCLNMGTETNMEALVGRAKQPARTLDSSLVDEVKSKLNQEDWVAVTKLWDAVGLLAKPLQDTFFQESGKTLALVEGIPVATPFGTVQGGYWPLVPDREVQRFKSAFGQNATLPLSQVFSSFANQIYPATVAVKERVGGMLAVSLDPDIGRNHIESVSHWITHIGPIKNMYRLFNSDDVRAAFAQTVGSRAHDATMEWVKYVANPRETVNLESNANSLLRYFRLGAAYQFIGFSLKTGVTVASGNILAATGSHIHPKYIGATVPQAIADLKKVLESRATGKPETANIWTNMFELSPQSRELYQSVDRQRQEWLEFFGKNAYSRFTKFQQNKIVKFLGLDPNTIYGVSEARNAINNKAWEILGVCNLWQMGIIWNSAYLQALDRSTETDLVTKQQKAAAEADLIFRRTNPAFAPKDLFPGQRSPNEFTRMFFTLGSDTTTMANLVLTAVPCIASKNYGKALMLMLPLMLNSGWMEWLKQIFGDQPIKYDSLALASVLGPVTDNFWGVKDIYYSLEQVAKRGSVHGASLPLPPAGRIAESFVGFGQGAVGLFVADTPSARSAAIKKLERSGYDVFGVLLNLPGGAIRKLVNGVRSINEGDTINPLALFGVKPVKDEK